MAMSHTWEKSTLADIRSLELSEGKIGGIRRKIRDTMNNRKAPDWQHNACCNVMAAIARHRPAVSAQQARKGADWLYRQAFKKDGQPRRTEFAQALRNHDLNVIRECYANPRFQLVDFEECEDSRGYITAIFPVYRCHGDNGKSFDYSARAWQSGGNSFVIEGSREYGRGF